jgi:hypothetical protein
MRRVPIQRQTCRVSLLTTSLDFILAMSCINTLSENTHRSPLFARPISFHPCSYSARQLIAQQSRTAPDRWVLWKLLQAEVEEAVVHALMKMTHSVSEMRGLHHLIMQTRVEGQVLAEMWQPASSELGDLQASRDPRQGRQAVVVFHS